MHSSWLWQMLSSKTLVRISSPWPRSTSHRIYSNGGRCLTFLPLLGTPWAKLVIRSAPFRCCQSHRPRQAWTTFYLGHNPQPQLPSQTSFHPRILSWALGLPCMLLRLHLCLSWNGMMKSCCFFFTPVNTQYSPESGEALTQTLWWDCLDWWVYSVTKFDDLVQYVQALEEKNPALKRTVSQLQL